MLTGGIEENGPYLTTGKHNNVLKATGESIARRLGNALVGAHCHARARQPGAPQPVARHHRALAGHLQGDADDIATSLRSQGFKDIFFLADSGGNQRRSTRP